MSGTDKIYVRLLGESVDAWRPVAAANIEGSVYRISDQRYDRNVEKWQFEPGQDVICRWIDSSDGRILAAVELK